VGECSKSDKLRVGRGLAAVWEFTLPSRGILNRLRVKADFLAAGRIVVSFGDKMRSAQRSVKVSPTRASDVLGVVANETPLHVGLL
jgi:hypothetical protein